MQYLKTLIAGKSEATDRRIRRLDACVAGATSLLGRRAERDDSETETESEGEARGGGHERELAQASAPGLGASWNCSAMNMHALVSERHQYEPTHSNFAGVVQRLISTGLLC